MSLDYYLGLATTTESQTVLEIVHELLGGEIDSGELAGLPGIVVTAGTMAGRLPAVYEEEEIRPGVLVDFSLDTESPEERALGMQHMFVAAANLSVSLDCDALLTFHFDVACMRRRSGRLELFRHWAEWQYPWVVDRLPEGYLLSDETPRY
jgi:hypothetical protein